ncbi:uncharacterized protein [Nicotiana tomentosiformis]|uniref:uncharacterized protein n=1 Tax=Nicotiana tomentosiformis TaxID=4098 RepID=UPI00388C4DF9
MAATGKCFLVTGSPGIGKTTLIVRVLETLRNSNPNLKVQGFYTREIREGTERVGFEVVTLDGRKGILASNKISRLLVSDNILFFKFLFWIIICSMSVMGGFPAMPHDPLDAPRGVLASLPTPVATVGPVVSAAPSDKRACASVAPPIAIASAQPQAKADSAARADNAARADPDAKDKVAANGLAAALVREDTDLFIIDEVGKMELYSSSFFPAVLKVLQSNIPLLASIPIPKAGRDIPGGCLITLSSFGDALFKKTRMGEVECFPFPSKGPTLNIMGWNAQNCCCDREEL